MCLTPGGEGPSETKLYTTMEAGKTTLQHFAGGKEGAILYETDDDQIVELFGVSINLGKGQVFSPHVRLMNEPDLRQQLAEQRDQVRIELRLLEGNKVMVGYG